MIRPLSIAELTMRVAMYYSNLDVRLEEMPRPTIGPGEILVRVMASGICGSDVLEWYRIKKAPRVLGHEIAGEIVDKGTNVEKFRLGDRVAVTHHVPCNTCHYCLSGHPTACETLHSTNFDPGGFAEYIRVPPINVDRGTFLLPDSVPFEEGTFVEPLACALRGQKIIKAKPGQTILILGSGISGILHLKLARMFGAGLTIATDIHPYRLDFARRCGADHVFDASAFSPDVLASVNGGRLADRVIVCAGTLAAAEQALRCVDRGGTVMFFAVPLPGDMLPFPLNEFWRNDLTLVTSYAAVADDLQETVELLRAGRIEVGGMITHRLPLARTGEGFRIMDRAGESMKIIIEPQK